MLEEDLTAQHSTAQPLDRSIDASPSLFRLIIETPSWKLTAKFEESSDVIDDDDPRLHRIIIIIIIIMTIIMAIM